MACPSMLVLTTGPRSHLALTSAAGADIAIPTPGTLTWVGASRRGELAAADGSAHVLLASGAAATTTWRSIVPRVTSGPAIRYPIWNGAWSPDGSLLALTAASPDGSGSSQVAVMDAATGSAAVLDVPGGANPVPPAWLAGGQLLVAQFDQRGARSWLRVTAMSGGLAVAGSLEAAAGETRVLATSGDGSIAAATMAAESSIRIGPGESWLLQGLAPPELLAVPDGATVQALALDRAGRCIAASVLGPDGTLSVIVAQRGAQGWQVATQRQPPAEATGVLVAWMP